MYVHTVTVRFCIRTVQAETEEEICTALLHDVVEDTKWTLKELEAEGFPTGVLEAVRLLTSSATIYKNIYRI